MRILRCFCLVLVVAGPSLLIVAPSAAELGDCGQPSSAGPTPLTSDALAILREAVGLFTSCDGRLCVCDVNGDAAVRTNDALATLRCAVGNPCTLQCDCPPPFDAGCTSASFFIRDGEFDLGWTGIAHGMELPRRHAFSARMKRTCSTTTSVECLRDADCPVTETCVATCNCNDDVSCELSGPVHEKHCASYLDPCTTNADCEDGVACKHLLGPPTPLSSGGTPICVTNFFESPLAGSFDSNTGEVHLSTLVRSRVYLGLTLYKPCPRCGAPDQDPEIGDEFTCDGGPRNGDSCIVHAVTSDFGGTSFDCPTPPIGDFSPFEIVNQLDEITTGTTTKQAGLPCKGFGFQGNPTVPGSNPKCLDRYTSGDPVCTSNTDCLRCSADIATDCASNDDCTGKGYCAEAPDQPVTCGFWCHCGFCNDDPNLPCFQTSDCPEGKKCQMGTGSGTQRNSPQARPNDCSSDKFICGGTSDGECATTETGTCSDQPYRGCEVDVECENFNAGFCNFEARPCFESRISRTGTASPLGAYCAFENKTCTSNDDCTQPQDFCAADAARSELVALFCAPAHTNSAINSAGGLTGPAALRLDSFMQICRCGDGKIGCEEECDDGGIATGDGCDELCRDEP
jgi:hypothetical protein